MTWLKVSTAATVVLGVFVDSATGATAQTSLTISQADIRLSKNGGAFAQTNNSAGATHMEAGEYGVPLDTTDTNTLGRLRVRVSESGALPVWRDFEVIPAQVWDSFFGADQLQVHVNEMTAGIITATVIADASIDAATFAAGAINAAAIAGDAITDAKVASDVTIASVTGAVGSVTAGVTLAANAVSAAAVAADAVTEIQSGLATSAALATAQTSIDDLPTNAELATSQAAADDATLAAIAALNNINVDAILNGVIEGSLSLKEALRLALSVLVGESSGGGTTTVTFRDTDDTIDRVVATVDGNGNRSAVVLDVTD